MRVVERMPEEVMTEAEKTAPVVELLWEWQR